MSDSRAVRAYNYRPGEREKAAERMRQRMADPVIADKTAHMASRRMKANHAAARAAISKGNKEK